MSGRPHHHSALHRVERHPEIKAEQLEHLVITAELPSVTLRVLSEEARLVFEHVSARAMGHDESVALVERMLA